ncbi:hypothetical protein ASE66_13605 [Bosea sp. Root483D1]|nr:hypothetical protein ASE66_13605 [Bosea sp. Root483D1]
MADASNTALAICRDRLGPGANLHLLEPDWEELPFESGTIDLLIANQVLYYLGGETRLRSAAREIARVLAPGGHALVSMIGPKNFYISEFGEKGPDDVVLVNFPAGFRIQDPEYVFPIKDEQHFAAVLAPLSPISIGYFDHALLDVTSSFHWLGIFRLDV